MEDRLLTIKQLAAYLNVNERTVLKLASNSELPAVRVGNQWRFRKAMVDTWLDDQMLGITRRSIAPGSPQPRLLLNLASCFDVKHIVPRLSARTKTTVIEELASLAEGLGLVRDQTWFVGALVQRENILPSATGNGIAFLHTTQRHPEQVIRPFMVLGRSMEGVDFDSLDGRPTHLFFVLGLKFAELHLPWLAKLTQMLAMPEAVKKLLAADDSEAIYDVLADCEQSLSPALAAAGT